MNSDVAQAVDNGTTIQSPLLRITRITVEDLFGLYRHDVALNSRDRVTIIHGPNGVGKTVLLKLVAAVFKADYLELAKTPFAFFRITFDDASFIEIRHEPPNDGESETEPVETPLLLELKNSPVTYPPYRFHLPTQKAMQLVGLVDRQIGWIHRTGSDTWMDQRSGEQLTSAEVVLEYLDRLPPNVRQQILDEPNWITVLRERVIVYLIETQRLLREVSPENWPSAPYMRGTSHVPTVRDYAIAILTTIQQAQAIYANTSQQLDQSFPQRLISGTIVPLNNEELKSQITDLESKRAALSEIGLMDTTQQFNIAELDRLPEGQRPAMTLFLRDSAHKLETLDSLSRRITNFLEIVNGRFKNKRILISRAYGMQARTSKGRFFDLAALSSGEQHELVLSYDLLFNVRPNTFVMIDEPEISLHLTWQKQFLTDLLRIVETSQIDVLLATHSPYIAGDRDDLMVPLVADVE